MNKAEIRYWELDRVGRGMATWRRERPDIDCSGKAVVGRILHLHDIILRAVDRALAPHGLKYPTYAVLATIRAYGAPYHMSPSELLSTLLLSSGGLSNLLRRMEKDGLIRRRADKRDGRGVIVELTEKGIAAADAAMVDHAAVEHELCSCLPPDLHEAVARGLGMMITVAER
ncbi:MarR family winged helix-turn-helix transcriptional regulator (plasmid) [Aquamicrobium terrae]